ncbi:MAG TPA: FAD binding domain-containing protein [Thermoanaerobaculia bacterium]|nr:FAD binding domain-containing protein [Thermoanaerobaculia bacterium]
MRDHLRLLINGREHEVRGRDVFATVANWLRARGATGTKIVCEEGDCGACTVLIRRGETFLPVNSCIQSMFQLDGASIVTVEGLGMNAVQQSMIAHHGAQCGYCTPGFVVAMTGMFETRDHVDEPCARAELVGNLCRCTGYEPIIKAACAVESGSMRRMHEIYPQTIDDDQSVLIEDEGRTFFAPTTLDDALTFKRKFKPCTIVQGATDVGVWINKRAYSAAAMLSLSKIAELRELREDEGAIVAGANVSLTELESFTRDRIPELHRILNIFGSAQIKNAGTLAGNIANGSPIGDTLPYLMVAGAMLEIASVDGTRLVDINQFYKGYKQFDLAPHEIIVRVRVPIVRDTLKLYKVSRRRDLDISAFTAAIRLSTTDGHINAAAIAYGGVAPTVLRLKNTESFLAGKPINADTFETAGRIARDEIAPISDVRGSRDYRLQLAENILCKFYYEIAT